MPFRTEFDNVFEVMKRACDTYSRQIESDPANPLNTPHFAGLSCRRVDTDPQSLDIMKDLVDSIRKATVCIVDITTGNSNVIFELGYAMALDKPLVIITQDREQVAFDLRGYRNIKYSATALSQLEASLLGELTSLMNTLPDPHVTELESSRSDTLAMTTASPTYFLTPDFRITYMNDAAALLFELSDAGHWLDKSLGTFMNEMADRIDNIIDVERNLQEQLTTIESLQQRGRHTEIPEHNVETIILKTSAYGRVELVKKGVAVRDNTKDSATSDIVGWVISFNVVVADNPVAFREFYKLHKAAIDGRLLRRHTASQMPARPQTGSGTFRTLQRTEEGVANWISANCPIPEVHRATDYGEKQECFQFARRVMLTPRYGLKAVRFLEDYFFDYARTEYLYMRAPSNDIVAVFRVSRDFDVLQFARKYNNLAEDIVLNAQHEHKFADAGVYLHPAILRNDVRRDCLAWLLGHAMYWCKRLGQDFIYAQIDSDRREIYETKFGMHVVGDKFQADGWDYDWWPILMPLGFKGDTLVKYPEGEITPGIDPVFCGEVVKAFGRARDDVGPRF